MVCVLCTYYLLYILLFMLGIYVYVPVCARKKAKMPPYVHMILYRVINLHPLGLEHIVHVHAHAHMHIYVHIQYYMCNYINHF